MRELLQHLLKDIKITMVATLPQVITGDTEKYYDDMEVVLCFHLNARLAERLKKAEKFVTPTLFLGDDAQMIPTQLPCPRTIIISQVFLTHRFIVLSVAQADREWNRT